jgi:hypothetical protein
MEGGHVPSTFEVGTRHAAHNFDSCTRSHVRRVTAWHAHGVGELPPSVFATAGGYFRRMCCLAFCTKRRLPPRVDSMR